MRVPGLPRPSATDDGYAVRVDWPAGSLGGVCHELSQFTRRLPRALRRAESTRRFWSRGPLRPLAVTVVPLTRHRFAAHPPRCASPGCPTTAGLLGMDPTGRPGVTAGHAGGA